MILKKNPVKKKPKKISYDRKTKISKKKTIFDRINRRINESKNEF